MLHGVIRFLEEESLTKEAPMCDTKDWGAEKKCKRKLAA